MRTNDWLLLVFLSLLWGASFFFAAVAVRDIPPLTLVLARVAIAALILLPIVHALGHKLPKGLTAWRSYAVLAILNNLIPFSLIFYGQTRIASALAAVLNATTPLFALILARLFAGETLTAAKVGGVLLGILGVAILMGPAVLSANADSTIGMLCVLGAAFSYGLSALWMRRLRDTPPMVSALSQLLCSRLCCCSRLPPQSTASGSSACPACPRLRPCWGWRRFRPRSPASSSSASRRRRAPATSCW